MWGKRKGALMSMSDKVSTSPGMLPISSSELTLIKRAPPRRGYSRQEYWSGFLFPPPEDFPGAGIEPKSESPESPALQVDSLSAEPLVKPNKESRSTKVWEKACQSSLLLIFETELILTHEGLRTLLSKKPFKAHSTHLSQSFDFQHDWMPYLKISLFWKTRGGTFATVACKWNLVLFFWMFVINRVDI